MRVFLGASGRFGTPSTPSVSLMIVSSDPLRRVLGPPERRLQARLPALRYWFLGAIAESLKNYVPGGTISAVWIRSIFG
jgi:hypothetical protein